MIAARRGAGEILRYAQDEKCSARLSIAASRTAACILRVRNLRFRRAHEGAHELAIGLRRKRIHVKPFFREKLARVANALNPVRPNLPPFLTPPNQLFAHPT